MQNEEMVGQKLGHYQILQPLGYGGSASVFLAQDIHLERKVAVKVFHQRTGYTEDFTRFEREARVLARLDHPHILPVYDYGQEDNYNYIVMPHMAGGSLRDRMRQQNGPFPVSNALYLLLQILDALQYAHNQGLIHRDIKPGNMLFKANGALMLSDFGLVKVLPTEQHFLEDPDSSVMQKHSLTGTPQYIAPEQIRSKATPASDIYALSAVLYEMVTGSPVFSAQSTISLLMKHLHEQPRPPREINRQIPVALERVILHALSKDADERYQTPAEFSHALIRAAPMSARKTLQLLEIETTFAPLRSHKTTPLELLTPIHSEEQSSTPGSPETTQLLSSSDSRDLQIDRQELSANQTIPLISPEQKADFAPQKPYKKKRSTRKLLILSITGFLLLFLLSMIAMPGIRSALGIGGNTAVITPISTPQQTFYDNPTETQVMPPTSLACPAERDGSVRRVVTAPLHLGKEQTVIYILNEDNQAHPIGYLKRTGTSSASTKQTIVKLDGGMILNAQISKDGQWILFTVKINDQQQIRMVRMDGEGQQTLYCAPGTQTNALNPQWSPDQEYAVFNVGNDHPLTYLMNLAQGYIETLDLQIEEPAIPHSWLDNSRLYMVVDSIDTRSIYLVNVQNVRDLEKMNNRVNDSLLPHTVATLNIACSDFTNNADNTSLYVSNCSFDKNRQPRGPSTITSQVAIGGASSIVHVEPERAIHSLRTVGNDTLLFLVSNSQNQQNDGLWQIGTDGKELTHLSEAGDQDLSFCTFTDTHWSNVSRDSSYFAIMETDSSSTGKLFHIQIHNLSHDTTFSTLTINSVDPIALVGWTQM